MPNILISYRRQDLDAIAGRIRDRVAAYYGEDRIFMDIDSIPFGLDFRKQVQDALMRNDVVLAIIGPKWLGRTRAGSARINETTDPVRIEIEAALARGIPVVPVLVGRANMPREADLPESLKQLSYLNAAEVSSGRDFNQQMERLRRSIDSLFDSGASSPVTNAAASSRIGDDAGVRKPEREQFAFGPLLQKFGIRFKDRTRERAFLELFSNRFYAVGQTSMLFGIVGWIVFGITDLLSDTGLQSTRFRFMLAMPLMLLFFGLSFTRAARRLWQPFFSLFAVVGITCMYIALLLVGQEQWYRTEQATMSFLFFIALIGMAPFTTLYTAGVGLFVVALHTYYLISRHPPLPAEHLYFYSLFVFGCYAIACTGAWFRERSWRDAFATRERLAMGQAGSQ